MAATGAQSLLRRIAEALERLAPPPAEPVDPESAEAFVWDAARHRLTPVPHVNRVPLSLLKGVAPQRDALYDNTRRFAAGLPANNALLWGARGTGKSSLIKSVHAAVNASDEGDHLVLVEVHREDIATLPALLDHLAGTRARCLLFCDDLSFEGDDASYKSLKAVLEGGVAGRPGNVLFYATSNRRHILSREAIENERAAALMPGDAVEEKVSLSDRFGLWLGFHHVDQGTYLEMVDAYAEAAGLATDRDTLHAEARAWAAQRGDRSGRVAWQFIQEMAGREGRRIALA